VILFVVLDEMKRTSQSLRQLAPPVRSACSDTQASREAQEWLASAQEKPQWATRNKLRLTALSRTKGHCAGPCLAPRPHLPRALYHAVPPTHNRGHPQVRTHVPPSGRGCERTSTLSAAAHNPTLVRLRC